ncbi:ATP-grasp domain-containing protein [Helicovermis profundi]
MILGAGKLQVNAIKKVIEMGHEVVAVDYYEDSIGKKIASYSELADAFNYEECLRVAVKHNIDGIFTVGTDQPVLTASKVSEKLNLPYCINSVVARNVTNKAYMKKIFSKKNIPTVKYLLVDKEYDYSDFNLKFPLVIKPVDSQGQRGIFVVNNIEEIKEKFKDVIKFSRDTVILVEEYYKNTEVTVTGWVNKGNTTILAITDRVTFEDDKFIGICTSHEFPTRHMESYSEKIEELTKDIVKAFNIEEGPIYFQMLVGNEGVKVNEIACRIGGAYEDIFIPLLTGIDILKMRINSALGLKIDYSKLEKYDYKNNNKFLSSQLFFANKGRVDKINDCEENSKIDYLVSYDYNYRIDDIIGNIENATQRAGYFIVLADSLEAKKSYINEIYNVLYIKNKDNKNLMIKGIDLLTKKNT